MTAPKMEVDLDTERINLDGTWFTREALASRLQQMLQAHDFRIMRVSEALDYLDQSLSGVRTLTLKLTQEQHAKLESAGGRLGKTAPAFARELLMQVLSSAVAASHTTSGSHPVVTPLMSGPVSVPPPPAPAPVSIPPVSIPPVSIPPSGLAAATTSDVTPEEAAAALVIAPKRRGDTLPGVPPVLTPLASPAVTAPSLLPADAEARPAASQGDGRRWFNRS
jgi:hypothetical protein